MQASHTVVATLLVSTLLVSTYQICNNLFSLILIIAYLVATSSKNLIDSHQLTLSSSLSLLHNKSLGLLLLIESISLDPSLIFQSLHELLMLPSNTIRQITKNSMLPNTLETQYPQSSRNDNALLFIVRVGDSLECGETADGVLATGGFVVDHAADGAPYHACGGFEVEGSAAGVGVHALIAELGVFDFVTDHCDVMDDVKM